MKIITYDNETKKISTHYQGARIYICSPSSEEAMRYSDKLTSIAKKNELQIKIKNFKDEGQMLSCLKKDKAGADATLLEINLLNSNSNSNGIAIAKEMRKMKYMGEILFLANTDRYYTEAFDVGAFHYLVKDEITEQYLNKVLARLLNQINNKIVHSMLLSNKGEYRQIKLKDIYYFEVEKRIVTVHYGGGRFCFNSTMEQVSKQLQGKNFLRLHRSFIVSFDAIEKIQYDSVFMKNGDMVPIGRTYQKAIQKHINEIECTEGENDGRSEASSN